MLLWQTSRHCVLLIGWLAGMGIVVSHGVRAEEVEQSVSSPTSMQVVVERAEVRSGPAEEYYPTGLLRRGEVVEVYQRTEQGWLGVRPPHGSFSWVPAVDAYMLPGGRMIEITNGQCVSWIGTELGTAKQYRWQVKLNRGEQLKLIGEATIENSNRDGEQVESLWYKVLPPAGEFRWIASSALEPTLDAQRVVTGGEGKRTGGVQPAAFQTEGSNDDSENSEELPQPRAQADPSAKSTDPARVQPDGSIHLMPGEIYPGEIVDGHWEDEVFHDGEYIVDGEGYYPPGFHGEVVVDERFGPELVESLPATPMRQAGGVAPTDRWHDWNAVEFTDHGMRVPLLERILGRVHHTAPSPLDDDPFDLSMADSRSVPVTSLSDSVVTPVVVSAESDVMGPIRTGRGRTPWRDPSQLRSKRLRNGLSQHDPDDYSRSTDGESSFADVSVQERIRNSRKELREELQTQLAASPARLDQRFERLADATSGLVQDVVDQAQRLGVRTERQYTDQVDWYGVEQTRDVTSERNSRSGLEPTSNPGVSTSLVSSQRNVATDTDIERLKLELSEIVAQPVERWNLHELRIGTQQVIEHGSTPVVRGKARLLLERIEEFESLAKRSGVTPRVQTAGYTTPQGRQSVVHQASTRSTNETQSALDGKRAEAPWSEQDAIYEATGWLVPVHVDERFSGATHPSHALTDDAGDIICYVSSLPGMKLDRYENQPVGINGLRGFLPQLRTGHIQAQRIVRLR